MDKILNSQFTDPDLDVAIIGIAGRFPGAKNITEFWELLKSGQEAVTFFSDEDLKDSGVSPTVYKDPSYVKAAPILEDADKFDASFFGYSPKEIQYMDPQQRLFLELSYHALEDGGYNPENYEGRIGVYGGIAMNTYFLYNRLAPKFITEYVPTLLGNDKDFLSTKVSYKLNLTGPSLTVQTACSTSLVAIHLACQSLLNEECEMALAGAAAVRVPLKTGHFYQENGIHTQDGHCKPFDKDATGTIFGSGGGIVLLKKLKNAIEDRDNIYALIKGTAINNDGHSKVDYTAPSINGQAQVIMEAQANAGVKAEQISYIEAHGTGTFLGDPIEIAALTKAFEVSTNKKGYCAVGSIKSNIGHLDAAAGIAGLLKVLLSLKNNKIPPSINFKNPNPEIDFKNTPFFINNKLTDWNGNTYPRVAGISSLGMGGTNSHVILQEAPAINIQQDDKDSVNKEVIMLSAKSDTALKKMSLNLAEEIENSSKNIRDVAYTLRTGRKIFEFKKVFTTDSLEKTIELLKNRGSDEVEEFESENVDRDVVFLFPGSGAEYAGMGKDLYNSEPIFRNEVERCLKITDEKLNINLYEVFNYSQDNVENIKLLLKKQINAYLSLFIVEYAMAKLLMSWGIKPSAMIGHSLGEYTGACISGVLNLEDALFMVKTRSELFQGLPEGAMLSVALSEDELSKYLNDDVSVAVKNSPKLTVVSGAVKRIEVVEELLKNDEIPYRKLKVSTAFHSKLVDPVLDDFFNAVNKVNFNKPSIPVVSNVFAKIVTGDEISNPRYWTDHIRKTVRFSEGIGELLEEPNRVFLEVGPGTTLATLTSQNPEKKDEQVIISSMRHPLDQQSDLNVYLHTIGKLHLSGIWIDWERSYPEYKRKKVSLPGYPFERRRHWYNAPVETSMDEEQQHRYFIPGWKRTTKHYPGSAAILVKDQRWLILSNGDSFSNELIQKLKEQGAALVEVRKGEKFNLESDYIINLDINSQPDLRKLSDHLRSQNFIPQHILYLWNSTFDDHLPATEEELDNRLNDSIYGLFSFVKNLIEISSVNNITLSLISDRIHSVIGSENLNSPEHAVLLGPTKVINKEFPALKCKSIDFDSRESSSLISDQIINESLSESKDEIVAYRNNYRWTQDFEKVNLQNEDSFKLKDDCVILITGGTGGIGLEIAHFFAKQSRCRFILTKRSDFPSREAWEEVVISGEDEVSNIIKKIIEIEELGSAVEIFVSDIGKLSDCRMVVESIKTSYKKLDLVVHTAGIMHDDLMLNKNMEEISSILNPKVRGTLNIFETMDILNPDIYILFSSISALIGAVGQYDYSAANNYLDSFASYINKNKQRKIISINWAVWKEAGILKKMKITESSDFWKLNDINKALFTSEAMEAFSLSLSSNLEQLIVFPGGEVDLRKHSDDWVKINTKEKSGSTTDREAEIEGLSEVEKQIAYIWMDILGVENPQKDDNFFKLGGSSLLAIQVISRIQENFDISLSIGDIFKSSTLESLGAKVEEMLISDLENPELNI